MPFAKNRFRNYVKPLRRPYRQHNSNESKIESYGSCRTRLMDKCKGDIYMLSSNAMHPVEKILIDNIDNPRSLFIFPTDVACSRWADRLLRIKGGGSIAMNKFTAWDTFKQNSVRSQVQKKKCIPGVLRKMFVLGLIAENAELCRLWKKPILTSLINAKWAQQAAPFAAWLTELLPQLDAWFSSVTGLSIWLISSADAARLAEEFDGDDRDLWALGVSYVQFLDKHGLFEPAWEKPPFDDTGMECFIFFPDCLRDYGEYRDLLEKSGHVRAIYTPQITDPEKKHDFFFYTNSRSEIKEAALYIRALNEREKINWDSIAVSIPDDEKYEPYVLREFKLRGIPYVRKTGKPLSSYPAGRLFSAAAQCVSGDFSLNAVNKLLLNDYLPWKDKNRIQKLLRFGAENNCVSSWTEIKDGKEIKINVWENAFEHVEGYAMERGFFKDLKIRINALRYSSDFENIRKNYFIFREHFFDMENCLPETDLILSRCISELSYLAEIEKSYPGVRVSDPFMFFVEYLGEIKYLAQQKESGVAILPYTTAAPAPFDCHIIIGASQENLSKVFSRLNFLSKFKREKLRLIDVDASEIYIALHNANSFKRSAFFCASDSFTGYSIPHSSLINAAQLAETPEPRLRYSDSEEHCLKFSGDLFLKENELLQKASLPPAGSPETGGVTLHKVQKDGFLTWAARKKGNAHPGETEKQSEAFLQLIRGRFFRDSGRMGVSASSLEKYYQCPLIWMFERVMSLESVSFEADIMPYTITGSVLHEILHEFLSEFKKNDALLMPPLIADGKLSLPDSCRRLLAECLNRVFDSFPRFPGGEKPVMSSLTALLLSAQKDMYLNDLENFLAAFLSYFAGCKVIGSEAGYFPSSQASYVFNGIIDCILETPSGESIIIDFKMNSMPESDKCNGTGKNGLENFQLPLYIKLIEANETGVKNIHTALFFSILGKTPQVLFGRIEDSISKSMYPKKNEELIMRDDERWIGIMKEFDEKILKFVNEAGTGQFPNIKADFKQCLTCRYNRICRTNYQISREQNISAGSVSNAG